MDFQFTKQLLLRRPVKKPEDYIGDPQLLLNDPLFRAAIRVATPAFFTILEKVHFNIAELSAREANTLQKYINRYCFRPTPFGLFSSVTLADWTNEPNYHQVTPVLSAVIRTSMPVQQQLSTQLEKYDLHTLLENNPSIYRVLNEYRFFRSGLDETGTTRDYQLQSIAYSKLLKDLLAHCHRGCSMLSVVAQISRSTDCSQEEAEDYAAFLVDSQFLVSHFRMSIVGGDHLQQFAQQLGPGPDKTNLTAYLKRIADHKAIPNPEYIAQLELDIQGLLPESAVHQDKLSIILKRDAGGEGLPVRHQQTIREGLESLALLNPIGRSAVMEKFIQSYQQHFEGQTLPLLQALDPEAGIGYQHPATEESNPLLETLHLPHKVSTGESSHWSPAHSMLLEAWLRDLSDHGVIRLQESDLERLKTNLNDEPLLGMSVLFRISENKVFIENAGGINAPALLGRFTVADEEIEHAAREMARELEALNPDVIFAELLHLADPHTDNINRRAHIYHYELPITAGSNLPKAQQVSLSDLYVSIIDHKVMLFSKQHQKAVIPRLSSAYNHSLNKLPLFRFLADLPYQYGRSGLGLDLRQLFPDLHFYPRVEYKDAILSLSTWVLTEKQITDMQDDPENRVEIFIKLSDNIQLPRYFSLAEGDQELVFDGQSHRDIVFFLTCIKQKKTAVLKEFLKQPEVRQYNAYLLPTKPLSLPQIANLNFGEARIKRKYVPGSEWLYLKIYAPKIGINRLLLTIRPLLHKRYGVHRISQWFFIRYDDHAPHIRLRLQVNPEAISEILIAFKAKLEDRIQRHVIREFQIDVYTRELERYAAGGIEHTERFFYASSELVLHYLSHTKKKTGNSTHAFALYSVFAIIQGFIEAMDEQLQFTLDSFQQFLPEFTQSNIKVELDKKYRELTPEIMRTLNSADATLLSGSVPYGNLLLRTLQPIKQKLLKSTATPNYLRSIIHMHLNRIFTDESRKQEMICYYLLHKYLHSVKGRSKSKQ